MKTRLIVLALVTIAVSGACSKPAPPNRLQLQVAMDRGQALDVSNVRYRVGRADVELTKVVPLPGGLLGLRFEISGPGVRPCCSLFPRIAQTGRPAASPSAGHFEVDVAESQTSIAPDGTLDLRLFGGDPEHEVGSFTIDLATLGVTY